MINNFNNNNVHVDSIIACNSCPSVMSHTCITVLIRVVIVVVVEVAVAVTVAVAVAVAVTVAVAVASSVAVSVVEYWLFYSTNELLYCNLYFSFGVACDIDYYCYVWLPCHITIDVFQFHVLHHLSE